jgi:uncharacterized protein
MTTVGLQLGAPGIYQAPELPDRSLRPVRLDVAGFVGVAPRGPVDIPTLVRSWSDYRLRFGAFEGHGRLPYAVSVFFEQGGERAYVVRVGRPGQRPEPEADMDRALLTLSPPDADQPVRFVATSPGAWGNNLSVRLEFDATPVFSLRPPPDVSDAPSVQEIELPSGLAVPTGSLLRVRGPGLPPLGAFRWVESVVHREVAPGKRDRVVVLDRPLPSWDPNDDAPLAAVVTGTLLISDGDQSFPRSERLTGLGLDPVHPEWIASAVVRRPSLLVRPAGEWTTRRLAVLDPLLNAVSSVHVRHGRDFDKFLTGDSFFDERTSLDLDDDLDPDPEIAATKDEYSRRLRASNGVARVREIGLLIVPDLFWDWLDEEPAPDLETQPISPVFQDCTAPLKETVYGMRSKAVLLDASMPDGFQEILRRQSLLVGLAEEHRRFVVLLDVPQRLDARGIARWRASFDSSYAAAYHPWLSVPGDPSLTSPQVPRSEIDQQVPRRNVVSHRILRRGVALPPAQPVPPSAFAAGIVAARERRLGLPWGPANELAAAAVVGESTVSSAEHDTLHPLGINVFLAERDGFRLTAARTLSRDPYLRQLSVRRLLTMLRLALERQLQWVVFEPNTPALRETLRHTLLSFLRDLYRAGAFVGASEEEAFFVRTDDDLNPQVSIDLGRLVVEVGVAPAEPVEFIVLRITREGDGGVRVEERPGNG